MLMIAPLFGTCLHTRKLSSQKILGVAIDRKLNFSEHVTNLCDKASKKIQALARIFAYIPQTQKRLLMNAYLCLNLVTVLYFG